MQPQYIDFLLPVYIAVPPAPKKKRKGEPDPAPVLVTDKKAAVKAGMVVRYELATPGRKQFQYETPDGAYFEGVLDPLSHEAIERLSWLGAVSLPK